ncbi:hypothetical protein M3Y97_00190000 [Aphelenchoides bicaudatus]|nr:hypothetical protein M3Y97_00190000 [Aphelenchoides bicaudatus]
MEVKVFKQGVGENAIEMIDETQFKNPEGSTFEDELQKKIDFSDEYDELVPKLPSFQVHKFGKNIGFTQPYWSTQMPRILLEKTWSTPDALRNKVTKPFKGATTPMPGKPIDEELLPPDNDNEPPKKHRLSNFNRRPATSNGKFTSKNTSGAEDQPQIQRVSPQPHRPNAFRRITISTTTSHPTTPFSKRTHPVWHNPNFIPTRRPLSTIKTTTSSPLIQQKINRSPEMATVVEKNWRSTTADSSSIFHIGSKRE